MPNITLPTEAQRANVDTDSFTWSNSEPGSLTKPHGALLKLIGDQLASGEYVHVISQGRGTGKTPKFLVQNTTNGSDLKIILRDNFSETKPAVDAGGSVDGNATTKSNVKVLLGSIDNVYLQDLDGHVSNDNFVLTYTNTETSTEIVTLDKSGTCKPFNSMTQEEIDEATSNVVANFHSKEVILNKDDAKLDGGGSTTVNDINFDCVLVCPAPHMSPTYLDSTADADEQARIEAWLQRDLTLGFIKVYSKLKVGAVAIWDKINYPRVNAAILDGQAHLDPAKYDSVLYNNTEADYTGAYQSFAIKKLSD